MRLFGYLNAVGLYQYDFNKIFVEHSQLPSIIRMSPWCAMPMSSCCVKLKASVTSMSLVMLMSHITLMSFATLMWSED